MTEWKWLGIFYLDVVYTVICASPPISLVSHVKEALPIQMISLGHMDEYAPAHFNAKRPYNIFVIVYLQLSEENLVCPK